jgi:hypothetical protein
VILFTLRTRHIAHDGGVAPKKNIRTARATQEIVMSRAMRMSNTSALFSPESKKAGHGDAPTEAFRVATGFAALAGTLNNAVSLALALRQGRTASFILQDEAVAITPSAAMSWKDVKMALMLARYALQRYGIVHPSAEQLHASLCGGEAATPGGGRVSFRGVLRMRSEGLHWGRIAAERFLDPFAPDGLGHARHEMSLRGDEKPIFEGM